MQRLSRTKEDTIWTQKPSNPKGGTPRCDTKRLSKLYQSPNQHIIKEESNQQMIDSKTHQHIKWEIPIEIESNNTWEIRHQIEKKKKIPTRSKDTKRRILLERYQV